MIATMIFQEELLRYFWGGASSGIESLVSTDLASSRNPKISLISVLKKEKIYPHILMTLLTCYLVQNNVTFFKPCTMEMFNKTFGLAGETTLTITLLIWLCTLLKVSQYLILVMKFINN